MSLQYQQFLDSHSTAGQFTAIKAVTIGGVALRPGDALPGDSPVRKDPRRLQILCRSRILSPVMAPVMAATPQRTTASVEPVPEIAAEDFSGYSMNDLRRLCKERGLGAGGTKQQLIARLQ